MTEDVTYPVPVSGRISEATNKLVAQAKKANALLSTGTLVRMAMESFMPRYVKPVKGARAELHAGLDKAIDADPEVQAKIDAIICAAVAKKRAAR